MAKMLEYFSHNEHRRRVSPFTKLMPKGIDPSHSQEMRLGLDSAYYQLAPKLC
jgi:hypothetical protein